MRFADLHLHTLFSDGTNTPEELIKESTRLGISAISVVDHDTVGAISSTVILGKKEGMEVIPGIELSAECNGLEVHILGYFIDYQDKNLLKKLDLLRQNRRERIYKIVDKLNTLSIRLNPQVVFNIAQKGTVGRLHIARALVKEGIVSSTAEAFQRYIGDNGPAYVCGFRLSPLEAIRLIKEVGGIPILAHPSTLKKDELIPQFIEDGLMGLEVYYPEQTPSLTNFYLNLASQYKLLVSGGSDYHGRAKPNVKIGMIKLPYELVEKLKAAKGI